MTIETGEGKKTSVAEKLRNIFCSFRKARHPKEIVSVINPEDEKYIEKKLGIGFSESGGNRITRGPFGVS